LGKSSIVKIIIIVAALGAAGVIYATTSREEKAGVAKDAKAIDFVCTKCGHSYQVPYEEFKTAQKAAAAQKSDEEGGSKMKRRRDVKPPLMTCPQCGEQAALPANRCPTHSIYYPKQNADGSKGKCPQCS
jgi:DNA-directed RNA polymerase subunit M/transcription elongation factor TFIIS